MARKKSEKPPMDWAEERAAALVRDYGTFPQLGETPRSSEPRTIRVIADALREAEKRGRQEASRSTPAKER